ncbi:RNA polymerase III transcription factor IIIC subunit-domain-containing protein, partial [Coniella lustricola]
QAPAFKIPSRTISAVEHPFLVMDVDKGLETFGPNPQFQSVLNPGNPHLSVPIYLHPEDPTSRPMMSHYASSHNIVFKVTVPKRTGRKRKRGSDEPWQGPLHEPSAHPAQEVTNSTSFGSVAKLDEPKSLRQKLQENVGRYHAEAVGIIRHTHRYRGMVDFNYSMKNNTFLTGFADKIMSGDINKFREVSIRHGTDTSSNQEIIAPPLMTQINIPYYYHYSQNPYVKAVDREDGGFEMVNTTAKLKSVGHFIGIKDPIPLAPSARPKIRDPMFEDVHRVLQMCMEERPVWTRRSILNRLVTIAYDPQHPERRIPTTLSQQVVKHAIQLVGYQFKGGPWRDALVRYGYDPRADASGRIYQTLIFHLRRLEIGSMGELWQEIRKRGVTGVKGSLDEHVYSHIFDGKTYSEDGKVWQVCDIEDPLLKKLFSEAEPRPTCDIDGSGWYHRGLWAKARAIMKCKMRAIQFGRELKDEDFEAAIQARDDTPELDSARSIAIATPDLRLTDAEWELVRG